MKRLVALTAALTLAALAPVAVQAQELDPGGGDGGGEGGIFTKYACAAAAGKSCTYKVTVDGAFGFQINCTDSKAKPEPEVSILGKGPVTTCKVRSDSFTFGDCMITGIPFDPDPIRIVAACQAKDGQNIF